MMTPGMEEYAKCKVLVSLWLSCSGVSGAAAPVNAVTPWYYSVVVAYVVFRCCVPCVQETAAANVYNTVLCRINTSTPLAAAAAHYAVQ
jgi:hypothetical protein